MNLKVGDTLVIHCYKHNGVIYESSRVAYILDIKDDYIVLGDENVLITKQDGRAWHTKGSAIMIFYTKRWFNVIAQFKDNGINYYCNIASPFIIENHVLKYIDYDLDLRVFSDGAFKILDRNEYNYHKKIMNYPKEINYIIKEELSSLIEMKKASVFPFERKGIEEYFDIFKKIRNK
ncbi:MAG: DUF402 domain-containing protein [Bacilli bacterium]|nr:DUF402 domain-containing protein [Bacilli bacterium]